MHLWIKWDDEVVGFFVIRNDATQYLQWWKQLLHNAPCGEVFVWLHGTPHALQSFVWLWPLPPRTSALLAAFSAAFKLSLSLIEAFALLLAVALEPIGFGEAVAFAELSPAKFEAVSLMFDTLMALEVCWFEVLLLLPPFRLGLAYSIRIPNTQRNVFFRWSHQIISFRLLSN